MELAKKVIPGMVRRFFFEAQIAQIHCSTEDFRDTDWRSIALIYEELFEHSQSPMVQLNLAVALAYSGQIDRSLGIVDKLKEWEPFSKTFSCLATEAHIQGLKGNRKLAESIAKKAIEVGGTPFEHQSMMLQLERVLAKS